MANNANPVCASSKLLGLELIRFACAMVVLVWHYHHFAMIGDGAAMRGPHMPFENVLSLIYRFGLFGVQIFWCISGFIFYWKYGDALASRGIDPKRFFWLRFSRLYPLHFVTLLIVAALQPLYESLAGHQFVFTNNNSITSLALQLVLGDQWLGARALSFNGPIWSVSSEAFVYIAFFVLLRAFGRSPLIIVTAIAAGLTSLWSGGISPAVVCAAYFFAGGAAAELLRSDFYRRYPRRVRFVAILLVILCLLTAWVVDLARTEELLWTWFLIVTPPCLLLGAQEFASLTRLQRPIEAAGNLTYSTYLIHFPMQLAVAVVVLATGITLPVGAAWFFLAYLAAALVLGRIVFTKFEAPVQDWIRAATLCRRNEPAAARPGCLRRVPQQ